jgi:glutamate--cysteine ligase
MMINASATHSVAMHDGIPFSRWLDDGHELGWPTIDDFAYHLTTLFPPVRPRGWLELRMLDALQEEWWPVAVAVTAALLDDPSAADAAAEAVAPVRDSWTAAARDSLAVPALHRAAQRCFAAALGAFDRLGVDAETVRATEAFLDRYVARGRCPADDRLDTQAAHASTVA